MLVKDLQSKKGWWEPFDRLLIATGALPFCPKVPGREAAGIFGLHSLESGITVRRVIDEERPGKAVIVGGGYICLLYTSPSPRDRTRSRMPSSA